MEFNPVIDGDFKCFLAGDGGYGFVGRRGGEAFYEDVKGEIQCLIKT